MSALRERLRAAIEAEVREVARAAMQDLWGRERVSVLIDDLEIGPSTGREGHVYTPVKGVASARLIADHPEDLPDERLWVRLAASRTLPPAEGFMRAPRVSLTRVRESIGEGWCEQALTFQFEADFTGVSTT